MSMTASEVAAYLEAHPEFFDQHSELLASVRVPHPQSDYAVPLVERQVLALRDKNRQLGAKMTQLIRFGERNDQIITRLHALSIRLVRTLDARDAVQTTLSSLERDFDITHSHFRFRIRCIMLILKKLNYHTHGANRSIPNFHVGLKCF